MNKLEPNMYVRTIDGVMKVKNIYQDGRENMDRFENEDGNIYFFNEIIGEPSFNPIDLIQVGDYVNSEIVTKVSLDNIECNYIETDYSYNRKGLRNKDIKSIVTKEQFSEIEYRLGDK